MRLRRKDGSEAPHSVGSSPLFANCSQSQRDRVEQLSTLITLPAGRQLTTEGSVGREFAVIVSGNATVSHEGQPVRTLGPGEYYGELALLDEISHSEGRRTATVTSDSEIELAVLSVPEFRTLLHEMPDVADHVRTAAKERMRLDAEAEG